MIKFICCLIGALFWILIFVGTCALIGFGFKLGWDVATDLEKK